MFVQSRKSDWAKWDLHVHTPESFHNNYKNVDDPWESFLVDLESLPPEFKVIGINDYYSIDGYEIILRKQSEGRLQNINLFLPVIELRLNQFGGTDTNLSKVNLHVIFSNELSVEKIRNGFLNSLTSIFCLQPDHDIDHSFFGGVSTGELEKLGRKIKESIPEKELSKYGTDLEEGINNFTLDFNKVKEILDRDTFKKKTLLSVGKTEWANVKWQGGAIADKKNVINRCDFVFTASESASRCVSERNKLIDSKVNANLLDCSDAHNFSDSTDKDRIGNSFTWIKAEPTFEGLIYARNDYADRVFIGDIPPKLNIVEKNKSKFIDTISFTKVNDSVFDEIWFDGTKIKFSHDLVAIIGNKGSGKSALADSLALLGNSANLEYASFLHKSKFLNPRLNKGKEFACTLTWLSGESIPKQLWMPIDETSTERIKYIPQGFFELVCNEVPGGEEKKFDKELKSVIFSHIEESDKLGKTTLDDLLDYVSEGNKRSRDQLIHKIKQKNEEIVFIENRLSKDNIDRENQKLRDIENAIIDLQKVEPLIIKSSTNDDEELILLNKEIEELNETTNLKRGELISTKQILEKANQLNQKVQSFEVYVKDIINSTEFLAAELGINISEVIYYNFDYSTINNLLSKLKGILVEIEKSLDQNEPGSIANSLKIIKEKRDVVRAGLDQAQNDQQKSIDRHDSWKLDMDKLIGSASTPDSLEYFKNIIEERKNLPAKLDLLYEERLGLANEIFDNLVKEAEKYKNYYKPIQEDLNSVLTDENKFAMEFSVNLVNTNFSMRFFNYIAQNRVGSFYGKENGENLLNSLLELTDFNSMESILEFFQNLMTLLKSHGEEGKKQTVEITSQLKSGCTIGDLYDLIFSLGYLEPRYLIKFDGKDLNELSPGERGIVLLVFYLLVDKDTKPLIIDQPEENLDNQTIYRMLVSAIKEGKRRRQVFIVTHNPNLAVVCNAEQIISCEINREDRNRITYYAGPIEDINVKNKIIDILEGTRPAFDYRKNQYDPTESIR